jgi:hypothetical protein
MKGFSLLYNLKAESNNPAGFPLSLGKRSQNSIYKAALKITWKNIWF